MTEKKKIVRNKIRQRILFTAAERNLLDSVLENIGCRNRSLFISEAINDGLQDFDQVKIQGRRNRKTDALISKESLEKIRELAATYNLTKQAILRHFIIRYMSACHELEENPERAEAMQ